MVKKWKDKLYYQAAEGNWGVNREYRQYKIKRGNDPFYKRWVVLTRLNWHYRVQKRESYLYPELANYITNNERDHIYLENAVSAREDVNTLADKLSEYDVVSFDVFDTLVFRPFSKPSDAFYLLEAKNGYIDFANVRQRAEEQARRKTTKKNMEVDIEDIYEELKNYISIDPKKAIEQEILLEQEICYPNPYMQAVYNKLIEKGIKVIVTSDMYLHEDVIRQILEKCGYNTITKIFVSCEFQKNKISGGLQKEIQEILGAKTRIIHVDDSRAAIEGCKLAGWNTAYYEDCNEIGMSYRQPYLNTPAALMYKGIVNNRIHNGTYHPTKIQEFGYIYGGIATCGYCEWINQYCRNNDCNKILFLARDTDIIYKVYRKYYSEFPSEYVESSRNALQELVFDMYPGEFISHMIETRVGLNKTIGEVLKETNLDLLRTYLPQYGLTYTDVMDRSNKDVLVTILLKYKNTIAAKFSECEALVRDYYANAIGEAKKICIVGLGWVGTEIYYLKSLIESRWDLDVNICGVVFGSMTSQRSTYLASHEHIDTYAFGPGYNQNLTLESTGELEEIIRIGIEDMFSSSESTLVRFIREKDNSLGMIKKTNNPNAKSVLEFQEGVLDFADDYYNKRSPFKDVMPISGEVAYEPLFVTLHNLEYVSFIMNDLREMPRALSGNCGEGQYVSMKQLIQMHGFNTTGSSEKVKKIRTRQEIINRITKAIPDDCDDIYIYKHHIGEIYIYLNLVKQYIERNDSKKPYLIINEKRYAALYQMFVPDIDSVIVDISGEELDVAFIEEHDNVNGHRLFCPTPDRFGVLRDMICRKIDGAHFYYYICQSLHLPTNSGLMFHRPIINESVKKAVRRKARGIGLNLSKFVVFIPEAVTASGLSMYFWESLCNLMRKNGYDVFVNTVSNGYQSLGGKTCKLGLDEIYYLSELSDGIFALINGLVVTFALMENPRYFIYTDQTPTVGYRMTSTEMLNAYTMSVFPGCYNDTLYEIDMADITERGLLKRIEQEYSAKDDVKL